MAICRKKPAYLFHKPTGQARVRIDGKDTYLGKYGTPDTYALYETLVGDWMRKQAHARHLLTVDDLILLYLDFAASYYVKNGRDTKELPRIQAAARFLVKPYGRFRVRDFGPLALKQVREAMIREGWARKTINDAIHRVRRIFRWGVENEHVPSDVLHALEAVPCLKRGKTTAPDRPPVQPVADSVVEATLPHLSPIVADMIRLQRLTGARPAEICLMRPCDVFRDSETWQYIPSEHKTEHLGRPRVIFIGPKGEAILRPYLLRAAEAFCFSPIESEAKRRAELSEKRRTPLTCGNRPGSKADSRKTERMLNELYNTYSYRRAIDRACDKAFPVATHPKSPSDCNDIIPWWRANFVATPETTKSIERVALSVFARRGDALVRSCEKWNVPNSTPPFVADWREISRPIKSRGDCSEKRPMIRDCK